MEDKLRLGFALVLAGAQQDGIPVTEALKNNLTSEFDWTGDVEDFRDRWTNRIEAYDWALANFMPNCSRQVAFGVSNEKWLTDYVVAAKGFVFWLNAKKPRQQPEIEIFWAHDKSFDTPYYGLGTSLMGHVGDHLPKN